MQSGTSSNRSKVAFTAVPHGISQSGLLKIAVLVSPKLQGGLGPAFSNWTQWVYSHNSFTIQIGSVSAFRASRCVNSLLPNAWPAFFADVPFTNSIPPTAPATISYDSEQVSNCVRDVYSTLGKHFGEQSPTALRGAYSQFDPAVKPIYQRIATDHALFDAADVERESVGAPFSRNRLRMSGVLSRHLTQPKLMINAAKALAGNHAAHPLVGLAVYAGRVERRTDTVDPRFSSPQELDFHRCVSLMMHHPTLQRALGLVLEFEVALPSNLPDGPVDVSVSPEDPVPECDLVIGTTKATLTRPSEFEPRNPDPPTRAAYVVQKGCIDVSDAFVLETAAIESGGLHVIGFGNDQNKILNQPHGNDAHEQIHVPLPAPPSLTTCGIALYLRKRKDIVDERIQKSVEFSTATKPVFYAEDLLMGFAVDIFTPSPYEGSEWYHPTQKKESFTLGRDTVGAGQIWEAPIRTPGVIASDKAPTDTNAPGDIGISDMLFAWQGFSMAASRPESQSAQPDPHPRKTISNPWLDLLKSKQVEPAEGAEANADAWSLLHFLYDYQVGLRPVYVTGNCPKFTEAVAAQYATNRTTLRRFEPVASPRVLLTQKPLPPEQLDVIVLRSRVSVEDSQPVINVSSPSVAVRYLVPPAAPVDLVKKHLIKSDTEKLKKGFIRIGFESNGDISEVIRRSDGPANPKHPYLPDPLCKQCILHLTDTRGHGYGSQTVAFYSDKTDEQWPDCFLNEIEFRGIRNGNPAIKKPESGPESVDGITDSSQKVVVEVPPGWTLLLHVSTRLDEHDRDLMALIRLIIENSDSSLTTATLERIAEGLHPMITPRRVLTLYHAVDRPIIKPEFSFSNEPSRMNNLLLPTTRDLEQVKYDSPKLVPDKLIRDVDAPEMTLAVDFSYDRETTGKIDLRAKWSEWIDDPTLTQSPHMSNGCKQASGHGPQLRTESATINELAIPRKANPPDGKSHVTVTHTLPDCKYHRVRYEAVGTSRYGELFPPAPPESFQLESTTRSFDVLASAAPDPPNLLYLLPSFGWRSVKLKAKRIYEHTRTAGVRIFLRRPWFSSGDDELLGVLVMPTDDVRRCMKDFEPVPFLNKGFSTMLTDAVSRWGGDPTAKPVEQQLTKNPTLSDWNFKQMSPTDCPDAADESLRLQPSRTGACGWDLQPPELRNSADRVHVVGFQPTFDEERSLWYCDVGFDSQPLYGTFLRLALVRYQPHAVKGRELSSIVLTDFSLLNADRTVRVTPNGWRSFDVELRGLRATGGRNAEDHNCFKVTIEKSTHRAGDIAWHKVADIQPDFDDNTYAEDPTLLWRGTISSACVCAGQRLVVREFESHTSSRIRPVYLDVLNFD